MSMLGSNLLLIIKKHCIANFFSFAVIVDVTDILQTSKHNFQFRAKHVKPCHAEEKYLSNDKKISVLFANLILMCAECFCLDIMEVVIGFSMLKKAKNETQKRTRMTCQIRTKMSKKKSKHVKKRETCRKSKERRKKTEKKRAKIARCLRKKVKTNFILFVSTLAKAFFAFQAFL